MKLWNETREKDMELRDNRGKYRSIEGGGVKSRGKIIVCEDVTEELNKAAAGRTKQGICKEK